MTGAPVSAAVPAVEQTCPEPLASATRLLLVTTDGMKALRADAQLYERPVPGAPWMAAGAARRAVAGRAGLGWGPGHRGFQLPGEPVKAEGDGRSPAGFFPLGRPFGFGDDKGDFLKLVPGECFCVDDPASPRYNAIVAEALAGPGISGERMWTVAQYRRGLLIGYPTDREARAGSCIFVHIWRSPDEGTAGCVALAESDVAELQRWSRPGTTAIGILPAIALPRFGLCLPGIVP